MTSLPARSGGRDDRSAPGIGDEEVVNDAEMEYMERPAEAGAFAEIRDHQGNIYMVGLDDLAAVGVDINRQLEISEDQMNALLATVAPMEDSLPAGTMKSEEYEDGQGSDQLTISILLDGSIKLVTAGGHESHFSSQQLEVLNIDTQNMTDEDIKRIVQLAGAATNEVAYEDLPEKRRKLEAAAGAAAAAAGGGERRGEGQQGLQLQQPRLQPVHQRSYEGMQHSAASSHSVAPSTSSGHPVQTGMGAPHPSSSSSAPSEMRSLLSSQNGRGRGMGGVHAGLIGESVKVQNAKGKIVSAVVRYSRPGMGYKVQTADGKFEWVPPERIIDRTPRTDMRDYDHKGYTSEAPSSLHAATPSTSSGGGPLMLSRRIFPPSTSSGGGGGGVGGASTGSTVTRALPIRSIPHHAAAAGHPPPPTNFCCPVCDRKVYQKEPAYIVIRLPACDACTREKILIVDENAGGGGGGGSQLPARPTMRSIGTDTEDLLVPSGKESKEQRAGKNEEIPSTTSPEVDSPSTATAAPQHDDSTSTVGKEGTVAEEDTVEKLQQLQPPPSIPAAPATVAVPLS